MSDVNDLASSLFGTSRAEVASGGTSTLYGTAATDSSGGSVSVRMGADTLRADGQAGTSVLVPTTADVRAGDTVIVTVSDGHPVVTGVVGSGDRTRADVEAAAQSASLAHAEVTKTQADIDAFKASAEATYSTKTDVDEKTKAVTESIEAVYLKKDDASTTYATKTELSKSADGIRSEVSEEYVTKDDAAKAYVGKSMFEQLASSIRSLVKGESTYTDPDGQSATSGIYSLVTQTRDAVTALFGDYTKTADLAATEAVRDAKKAGTDAQAAASAAQTTADSASSTAGAAKSTADSLATLIRADSTGITVGKSADGKTYSTGRTHMTDSAFEVLDKAGAVITQLAADGASFLSGLVKMIVGKTTLPGNLTVNSITIDSGGGVAVLRGIISRLSANLNGVTSSVSAGWEQDFGYGVTAIVRESAHLESAKMVPERTASAHLASDKAELYVGDNSMKVTGGGFELSHPEYLRKGLRITQGSKVCHGHGTPWVTLFETWAEFKSATGCYDSGTPTLVTMNGDWHAFDGTLSGCEIRGGYAVYVLAQTTSGLPNISSSQSLRINWICIW